MPETIKTATRLARGSTADVYAWGDGRVLKLFHEHIPIHANKVAATRAAHEAGLPVPAVLSNLVEVGQREGIIFERIKGPTLNEYLQDQPKASSASLVTHYAHQAAELHAQIHSIQETSLPPLVEILHWSIQEAHPLDGDKRQAILNLLHNLAEENALCHNDFYPGNLVVSHGDSKASRLLAVDWALGMRGNPLADCARTWLISRMWLQGLREQAPDHVYLLWKRYWDVYFRRYTELRPFSPPDLLPWQAVTTAASLCWDGAKMAIEPRVSLVQAALNKDSHPWLYRREQSTAIACA